MELQLVDIQGRAATGAKLIDEELEKVIQVIVPELGLGAAHRAPDRHGEVHLADAAPVEQTAFEPTLGVAPKQGVIDVRVPMAKRDHGRIVVKMVLEKRLLLGMAAGLFG